MKHLALLVALLFCVPAFAESDTVRIAQPYGLSYLPSYVVQDLHPIEHHAHDAGLGDITVAMTHLASGAAVNDLILSGGADLGMGGFGPAFVLWDKTRGAQKVRCMMPLGGSTIFMYSVDPRIKSLKDFRDGDKIAISAIKVTDQAITLQMAAAKEWGWDQRFRFDPWTVSMSNPDAMTIMLSANSEVKSHFAIVPFAALEGESGKAHLVMTSADYLGPNTSGAMMWASARFHDPNPKLYAATAAAFEEAIEIVNRDSHLATQIYLAHEPQKREPAWIEAMITNPKMIRYDAVPHGTKDHADFMFALGTLKNKPDSWKDLFWENAWGKDGS